jgi:hypothetical protein
MATLHYAQEKGFEHDGVRYQATLLDPKGLHYDVALEAEPHASIGTFAIQLGDDGAILASTSVLGDDGNPKPIDLQKKIRAIGNAAIAARIVWHEP